MRHIFGKNERTTYLRRTDLKFCQNLIVLIIIQDSTHDAGMSKRRYGEPDRLGLNFFHHAKSVLQENYFLIY